MALFSSLTYYLEALDGQCHTISFQNSVVSNVKAKCQNSLKRQLFSFPFLCRPWQDVEIDIELAPGDQTAIPKTKEQAERDTGNQLHMLTNRHDKFLDSLREVKVRLILVEPACTLSFSSEWTEGLTKLTGF